MSALTIQLQLAHCIGLAKGIDGAFHILVNEPIKTAIGDQIKKLVIHLERLEKLLDEHH